MTENNNTPRIYSMKFSLLYPLYIAKAEKKKRTKSEVNTIICWLTGYTEEELESQINRNVDVETFFTDAPQLNPLRSSIKGKVCNIQVEELEDSIMKEIRYLDLLVDKLAKGKSMDHILPKKIID